MSPRSLAAGLALLLCGCMHLHDDRRQKLAEEARDAFEAMTRRPAASEAIGRHTRTRQALDALTAEMEKAADQTALDALLSHTWESLTTALGEEIALSESEVAATTDSLRTTEGELALHLARLAGKPKAADLASAMSAASLEAARHEATQELLRLALLRSISGERASWAAAADALGQKKRYAVFALSGDRMVQTEKLTTVAELLGIDAASLSREPSSAHDLEVWGEAILKIARAAKDLRIDLRDRGIAVTLIGLGLDLSHAEELRILREIEGARAQLALHQDLREKTTSRLSRLKGVAEQLRVARRDLRVRDGETIRDTLERAAAEYRLAHRAMLRDPDDSRAVVRSRTARGNLAGALMVLANDYRYRVLNRGEIDALQMRIDRMATDRAMAIAAINLAEHEALVSRGLEGLLAFHQSGFDAGDTRDLIGLAQAAGLFAIGGL